MIKKWFKSGDPWIWLNSAEVSTSLIIVLGLLLLIAIKGLSHFWPKSVMQAQYIQSTTTASKPASMRIIGELHEGLRFDDRVQAQGGTGTITREHQPSRWCRNTGLFFSRDPNK